MVSRVGVDPLGREMATALSEKGFDLSLVQQDSTRPTGTVGVSLQADGSPHFTIHRDVAYDYLEAVPVLLELAAQVPLICFGTLIQRSHTSRTSLYQLLDSAPKAIKFLDINLRADCFNDETVVASLERADILKLNSSEVQAIASIVGLPDANEEIRARAILERFDLSAILVTRGEHGVYALSKTGEEVSLPGLPVSVVDTIGSGDSFSAGFISRLLAGASLKESCYFGNVVGALNATRTGGMPHIAPDDIVAMSSAHPL